MTDVNLHMMLEMRKKSVGVGWHLFHGFMTMCTGFWLVFWIAHWLSVVLHNRNIDKQQDKLLAMQVINSRGE